MKEKELFGRGERKHPREGQSKRVQPRETRAKANHNTSMQRIHIPKKGIPQKKCMHTVPTKKLQEKAPTQVDSAGGKILKKRMGREKSQKGGPLGRDGNLGGLQG